MTIGPDRSDGIKEIIRATRPNIMSELGGYVGYSAILFGNEVREAGGTRYISLGYNEEYAGIARSLVDFAGLGDFLEIRMGLCSASLERFVVEERRDQGEREKVKFDVLFVDHAEDLYLPDLKICEKLHLVSHGSVVIADNVGGERASEYVRGVEEGDEYETTRVPCMLPKGEKVSLLTLEGL